MKKIDRLAEIERLKKRLKSIDRQLEAFNDDYEDPEISEAWNQLPSEQQELMMRVVDQAVKLYFSSR